MRIRKLNSPHHTKVNKSIPSGSVDTQVPLAGKVAQATVTRRGKGGTTRTCALGHARTLPSPVALVPEIKEGTVHQPTDLPLDFPWPGIGLVRIQQLNSPYHTKVNKYILSSSVDIQIPLAGKVALDTGDQQHNRCRQNP